MADSRCAVFDPSDARRIKIATIAPRGSSAAETRLRDLLTETEEHAGYYGLGELTIEGTQIEFNMYLDPLDRDRPNKNCHKTTFSTTHTIDLGGKLDFNVRKHKKYAKQAEFMQ